MMYPRTSPLSDDLVLDFFAGSGTVGEAVYRQNQKDGGRRRFIAVQLPEPHTSDEFATVAEVTKERLRRAGRSALSSANGKFDAGFRCYKLATSNIKAWAPNAADIGASPYFPQVAEGIWPQFPGGRETQPGVEA
jgi:adenine-specific DNA-methyltransferase